MKKKEMENYNMVMSHLDKEGMSWKTGYSSGQTAETKGKHRRAGATSSLQYPC